MDLTEYTLQYAHKFGVTCVQFPTGIGLVQRIHSYSPKTIYHQM